jgi:hypothetical protein
MLSNLEEIAMCDFEENGYLGQSTLRGIEQTRAENSEWFDIAKDVDNELMKLVRSSQRSAMAAGGHTKLAIAILMRSCSAFQGVILLAERRMYIEACMLTRTIVENSFGIAALIAEPDRYISILRDDEIASKKKRGKIIVENGLDTGTIDPHLFRDHVEALQKGRISDQKNISEIGSLKMQYLLYSDLSDRACHLTLRSVSRYYNEHALSWNPASKNDVAFIISNAAGLALACGFAASTLLKKKSINRALTTVAERLHSMRPPSA